jgi:hypothetical protein
MALAAGLMARFDSGTSISTLLGLQVLFSIGVGTGAFQMVWAGLTTELLKRVRERGPPRDVMQWISFAIFAEMLGASVGISIAQTVFTTQLSREVKANNLEDLLHSGVTNFREGLNSEQLDTAIVVFNTAITRTFYVATAAGAWPFGLAALILLVCIPISPCLFLMWRRRRARSHVVDNTTFPPPAEIPGEIPAELAAETSSSSSQSRVRSAPVSETISSPEHGSRPPNQSSLSHIGALFDPAATHVFPAARTPDFLGPQVVPRQFHHYPAYGGPPNPRLSTLNTTYTQFSTEYNDGTHTTEMGTSE